MAVIFNNIASVISHLKVINMLRQHWQSVRRRWWRTKSVADRLDHIDTATAERLPRVLGVVDLTFLGIGSIVGAGVYVLSGVTARSLAGYA